MALNPSSEIVDVVLEAMIENIGSGKVAAALAQKYGPPALIVTPHPVTLQGQRKLGAAAFEPGEYLDSLLARQGVVPGQQWVVSIDGVDVPEHHWHRVRPKHGYLIEARRVPERDVLRIVAIAALSYFTFGAGGVAGGGFLGLTGTAAVFAAGAAYLAGSLVINKLLAPKQPGAGNRQDGTTSPTYSLSGGRNRARPFEPLALVLGEPYSVPDIGAQPYTFFANGEQYLWQIFNLGINCRNAGSLRIGQTSISNYLGVTILSEGLVSGNSTFPALGTSVDSVEGALLTAPTSPGSHVTRTSSVGTVMLAVDLVASLFEIAADGTIGNNVVDVEIEYQPVGGSGWLPFTDAIPGVDAVTETTLGYWGGTEQTVHTRVIVPAVSAIAAGVTRLRSASQKPLRITLQKSVDAGQYEVRMRKIQADYTGTSGANAVEWVSLKSYQADTANYDGQARLAVQIQASGQLNGALDELNMVLVANTMPIWDGSDWVTASERSNGLCNPGAIFLLLARGIYDSDGRRLAGLGYSDDQIDIAGLQAFMVHCTENNFEFDLNVQDNMSIDDLLEAVAYAGMGEKSWPDGKLGVTFYTADDPIEGVINMANIKARSFEIAYDTMPTADEIEFQFFDRARGYKWTSLRILAPGVTLPRSTARVTLTGITGEAHAATMARFSMAQNIYQRKTVTCEMDLEYLTVRKGSVVSLSHDMTQWGYSGRLLACEDSGGTITLTLDDIAPETNPLGGGSPYIGLRLPGETQMRVFAVASVSPNERTVTLTGSWPGGVDLPGADEDNPARDTLWVYDFKAVPGQKLQVVAIEPSMNGARLTMVPISDEFWDYVESGEYIPPPNNSLLRPAPEVTFVNISEQLARQGNTFYTELSLDFEVDGSFSRAELWGATGDDLESPPQSKIAESNTQTLRWRGGLDERWHLELRVYGDTRASEPYRLYYDVQGLREPPPPFDVFTVLAQPDGTRQFNFAYTTTSAPVDWLGAEIRYLFGSHTTPAWDDMLPLQVDRSYYTASPVEVNQLLSGVHTFACRSLDTTWNQSTVRYFEIDLPPRRLGNTVAEYNELAEGWTGTLTDCEINTATGGIEAISTTTWTSLTSWTAWTRWNMNPEDPIVYTGPVRDLSAVLTSLVDASASVQGDATIELRYSETSDNPVADPGEWTSWGPADVKVVARYIQVRVTVEANGGDPIPMIDSLSYLVSAPLLNDYINDVDISTLTGSYRIGTGDVRIPMPNTYGTLLELQVVIQDASSGAWTWQLIDKTLTFGPRVQFKLNGTLADPDLVDFIVKGF